MLINEDKVLKEYEERVLLLQYGLKVRFHMLVEWRLRGLGVECRSTDPEVAGSNLRRDYL